MFTCSRLSIFSLGLSLGAAAIAPGAWAAAAAVAGDPYEESVAEERSAASSEHTQEYIASGAAAIVIGLYGYYNTAPNPLIKLLYAATQTAGVLTMGQAIRNRNTPISCSRSMT